MLDTIVGSALMLVVFVGVAAAFQLSVGVVTNNKARAGAIALANERMEYIPLSALRFSRKCRQWNSRRNNRSFRSNFLKRSFIHAPHDYLYGADPYGTGPRKTHGESMTIPEDNDNPGNGIDNFPDN